MWIKYVNAVTSSSILALWTCHIPRRSPKWMNEWMYTRQTRNNTVSVTFNYLLCIPFCVDYYSGLVPQMKCRNLFSGLKWSLGFIKCDPRAQNINSTRVLHAHRICEAVSPFLWHLPQAGLFTRSGLNKCNSKWLIRNLSWAVLM